MAPHHFAYPRVVAVEGVKARQEADEQIKFELAAIDSHSRYSSSITEVAPLSEQVPTLVVKGVGGVAIQHNLQTTAPAEQAAA